MKASCISQNLYNEWYNIIVAPILKMRKFEEKREIKRTLYSKPILLALFIVIIFLSRAVWHNYQGFAVSRDNRQAVEFEKKELENRIADLDKYIKNLETERGVEGELRDKFGVAKSDEEVIILVDSPETATGTQNIKKGFWSSLFGWFR